MRATVAVIGASGFIGSAVHSALVNRGAHVVSVKAPRLNLAGRDLGASRAAMAAPQTMDAVEQLRSLLAQCDVVVNAAGVAHATGSGDAMYGANALLAGVVAAATPPEARLIHVSSAGVQGRRRVLDETRAVRPFSSYTTSKALGESLVLALRSDAVVYRPTSVHGLTRNVTASLVRVLRSRAASVASGRRPTPQVLLQNVGDATAFLALVDEDPPSVVLHPWEGMTTQDLFRVLDGRRPLVIPASLARGLLTIGYAVGQLSSAASGIVRRVEILWLGQEQTSSWLEGRWTAPVGEEGWRQIANANR